ncbi:MAG: hypothetical protein AAGD25_03380 [Cyanobacteria bacterium P01_F01_bin.150]
MNLEKKINLGAQHTFSSHRSGWGYALDALKPLHNPEGLLFDGFLEMSFMWKEYKPDQVEPPYRQPWVGFLHNPPIIPQWFFYPETVKPVIEQPEFQDSLYNCVGIFCLSQYLADWLQPQINKPVSSLIYPTEIPDVQFDFDRFVANGQKKIVQLGWFLRKLNAIYQLPIAKGNPIGYEKVKLNPNFFNDKNKRINWFCEAERKAENLVLRSEFLDNTRDVDHVSNQDYDVLLSENIGFLCLYDASANTAVVECIARATPLLINPRPAVVEYLGIDYPLYFETLEEAAQKIMDLGRVKATHEYLKNCDTRKKISGEYFLQSFVESDIYRQLQVPAL